MTEKEAKELKQGERVKITKENDTGSPLFDKGRKYEVDKVASDGHIYTKPFDHSVIDKALPKEKRSLGIDSDRVEKVEDNK